MLVKTIDQTKRIITSLAWRIRPSSVIDCGKLVTDFDCKKPMTDRWLKVFTVQLSNLIFWNVLKCIPVSTSFQKNSQWQLCRIHTTRVQLTARTAAARPCATVRCKENIGKRIETRAARMWLHVNDVTMMFEGWETKSSKYTTFAQIFKWKEGKLPQTPQHGHVQSIEPCFQKSMYKTLHCGAKMISEPEGDETSYFRCVQSIPTQMPWDENWGEKEGKSWKWHEDYMK